MLDYIISHLGHTCSSSHLALPNKCCKRAWIGVPYLLCHLRSHFSVLPLPSHFIYNCSVKSFSGIGGAFVTKLNAAGNALIYSTYLGGSGFIAKGGNITSSDSANGMVDRAVLPSKRHRAVGKETGRHELH